MSEKPELRIKPGDVVTAWLGGGSFSRRALVIDIDQDAVATVRYLDYPQLGIEWVRVENLQ